MLFIIVMDNTDWFVDFMEPILFLDEKFWSIFCLILFHYIKSN